MKTYDIPAALAIDYRRLVGGARLRDADGDAYLVPHRSVQRALGPERYVIELSDGVAIGIEDLTYPVTLVPWSRRVHVSADPSLELAAREVLARWDSGDLAAAVRDLNQALEAI